MQVLGIILGAGFFLLATINHNYVWAETYSLYCDQVESTAATQTCLKNRLDNAQAKLNKSYKILDSQLENDKKAQLAELQKTWLTYRDTECMWEKENLSTPALKHINELSCMARLTEDRADILTIISDDTAPSAGVREYGSFPRWMNVVAKEYPDVQWNYGGRKNFDLDCDGEDEFFMIGSKLTAMPAMEANNDGEVSSTLFSNQIIFALVQNPNPGKPTVQTFSYLMSSDESENTICSSDINFDFIKRQENADTLIKEPSSCDAKLVLKPKNCAAKTIIWTGKEFALELPIVDISSTDNQ